MVLVAASASAQANASGTTPGNVQALQDELEELKTLEFQIRQRMRSLEGKLDRLDGSDAAPTVAGDETESLLEPVPAAAIIPGQPLPGAAAPSSELEPLPGGETASSDVWSMPLGSEGNLRLVDIALSFTGAGGWSTQGGEGLRQLEGGHHDPSVRGFTVQDLELYIGGAVDPYFNAQSTLSFSVNTEGETSFEIEEGFATSQQLPFGIEEYGLALQGGWFFALEPETRP